MKRAALVIVVLALIIGGALALRNPNKKTTPTNPNPTNNTQSTQPQNQSSNQTNSNSSQNSAQTNTQTQSAKAITYTSNGFVPATLTVKSGDTITITNSSSRTIQFNSDPHPAHTDNSELNVGTVAAGQSQTFTVTAKGTWGYHNHLNPSDTGTIIVQ